MEKSPDFSCSFFSVCMHVYIMLPLAALNHFYFPLFCSTLPVKCPAFYVVLLQFILPRSLHLMHWWNCIHVILAELWAIIFKCFVILGLCSPSGTPVKHTLDCLILSFTARVLPLALHWPFELCLNSGIYRLTCSAHYANSLRKFFLTVRVYCTLYVFL